MAAVTLLTTFPKDDQRTMAFGTGEGRGFPKVHDAHFESVFLFGYMNFFQQLSTGNQYRSIHTARVFYFHNMDLRKKEGNGN